MTFHTCLAIVSFFGHYFAQCREKELRLWFIWNMWKAFTFDLRLGVKKYVTKLKGILVAIGNVREVRESQPSLFII